MPDKQAQFEPHESDYRHDLNLAQTLSWQVRERVALGEHQGTVIRDIIANNVRAYIGSPWIIWHKGLQMFLTPREFMDMAFVQIDEARAYAKANVRSSKGDQR